MLATVLVLAVLHSAREVRSLSPAEAARAYPVQVRGVVTNLSGWKNSFFFQDDTGGISVDRRENADVRPGDEVEIDGDSAPGLFAPIIMSNRVRVVGHRLLPPAPLMRFDQLAQGQQDAQRVAVRGIIRSATIAPSWGRTVLFLYLDLGTDVIQVRVHDFANVDPSRLVDADVRVEGVCGTNFNERRQFISLRLFVNDLSDVVIEREPSDPFSIAAQPVSSILQFSTVSMPRHRVKIEGAVTYQSPGRFLYVQNGDDGMYVESAQRTAVSPGTAVEVAGFAATGQYSPILLSAVFRPGGVAPQPRAVAVRASQMITRDANMFLHAPYDARLVTLQGNLVERVTDAGHEVLVLRDDQTIFRARLERGNIGATATGSLLRVTGVCSIRADESREPRSFEIELRTPADVAVLQQPSWWNLRHSLQALGFAILCVLIAIAWAASLQIRVKVQTRVIQLAQERLEVALANEQESARSDFLTGVRNRRAFYEAGRDELLRAQRYKRPLVLAYVDLDNFKVVNDTLGHDEGDRLLITVADVLRTHTRATDVIARVGGDEFGILLPETGGEAAQLVLEKVRAALAEAMQSSFWPVTFSIGAISCETPPANFEALMSEADQLMYSVKKTGKDRLNLEVRTS